MERHLITDAVVLQRLSCTGEAAIPSIIASEHKNGEIRQKRFLTEFLHCLTLLISAKVLIIPFSTLEALPSHPETCLFERIQFYTTPCAKTTELRIQRIAFVAV